MQGQAVKQLSGHTFSLVFVVGILDGREVWGGVGVDIPEAQVC